VRAPRGRAGGVRRPTVGGGERSRGKLESEPGRSTGRGECAVSFRGGGRLPAPKAHVQPEGSESPPRESPRPCPGIRRYVLEDLCWPFPPAFPRLPGP